MPTILAIGMIAFLIANVAHEGLGHGGACLLVGGRPIAVSSAWFDGDTTGLGPWASRVESAGGTVANLLLGSLLLGLLRARAPRTAHGYYLLWLTAIVNLFQGGGYLATSPLFGFGDWGAFLRGLEPVLPWKLGLTLLGCALYFSTLVLGARTLAPLVAGPESASIARRLCYWPYFVIGGGVFALAAAFNPLGRVMVVSSVLAHLGGCAWLVWLPEWVRVPGATPGLGPLTRHRGYLFAGALAFVICVFVLGPSIPLGPPR